MRDILMIEYDKNNLPIFKDSFHTHMSKENAYECIELLKQYIDTADFKQLKHNEDLFFYNDVYKPNMIRTLSLHGKKKVKGCVYFVKKKDGSIKIGCSSQFEDRIKRLKKEFGELEIIHLIETENMYVTEFAFHELFNKRRIKGEWFNLDKQLINYIKSGQYYDFIQITIDGNDFNYDVYFEEFYSRRAS